MTPDDGELVDRLRRALRAEAERVAPAGDGLIRIRARVGERRRRLLWLRPMLVVTAAAGVASLAIAAPALLREIGQRRPAPPTAAGPGPSSSPPVTVLESRVGAGGSPRTLPPESGVTDMRTVWPYVSRAEGYYSAGADVSSGRHPELTDAAQAAVTFVRRYVGPRVTLSAGGTTAQDRGVAVVVNRRLANGDSHPVTQVHLVQVSKDGSAPYVVADAQRPALGDHVVLSLVPPTEPVQPGTDHITVSGTIRRPGAAEPPAVHVEVGDASGAALSFNRAVSAASGTAPGTFTWTASISLDPDQVDRAVSVAAWTLDGDADVLEFVAAPVPLPADEGGSAGPSSAPEPTGTPTAPAGTESSGPPTGTESAGPARQR